jgi:hypothetical protein
MPVASRKSLQENFAGELPIEEFLRTYLPPPFSETSAIIDEIIENSAVDLTKAGRAVRHAVGNDYASSLVSRDSDSIFISSSLEK